MVDTRRFNTLCVALSIFFVMGTVWEWRSALAASERAVAVDAEPVSPYQALADKDDLSPVSFDTEPEELAVDPLEGIDEEPVAQGGPEEDMNSVLPARVHLSVPFTSQAPEKNWDQPWQDACEEAVVLMLDAYYKGYGVSPLFAKDEILRMVAWEENKGWGGSINIEEVVTLAQHVTGRQTQKILTNPTVADIKQSVASGHPVLVVADGKILPNPHFSGDGPDYHALVVRGYTETTFITNDPGTQFGENFEYAYDDLLNAIRDWNDGDVKSGKRVVMVME